MSRSLSVSFPSAAVPQICQEFRMILVYLNSINELPSILKTTAIMCMETEAVSKGTETRRHV